MYYIKQYTKSLPLFSVFDFIIIKASNRAINYISLQQHPSGARCKVQMYLTCKCKCKCRQAEKPNPKPLSGSLTL